MLLKKYLTFIPPYAISCLLFLLSSCSLFPIPLNEYPTGNDQYQPQMTNNQYPSDPYQQPMMPPFFDQMNDNEKAEMMDLMKKIEEELKQLSPEELADLEKKARKDLVDMGINPDTFQPIDANAYAAKNQADGLPAEQTSIAEQIPEEVYTPIVKTPEQESVRSIESSTDVLRNIIRHLESIRQKNATYSSSEKRQLDQWKEAIDDLVYYLKIINKSEHHERLSTQEFNTLFNVLKSLEHVLAQEEPHLSADSVDMHNDNPYMILGLKPTATNEEIHTQYKMLAEQNKPEVLRKKLIEQGFEESAIKRQLKSAKLLLATFTDAYEKLNDPKVRTQTDRNLTGLTDQQKVLKSRTAQAATAIINELSQAIYQQMLISLLEQFLQKYEPTELALKKEMESAQAKRKEEQKNAARLPASVTPGTFSTPLEYQTPSFAQPGNDYYAAPANYQPYTPEALPPANNKAESDQKGKTSKSPSARKREDKTKDEKSKDEKSEEALKKSQKTDTDTKNVKPEAITKLIKKIDEQLTPIQNFAQQAENEKTFDTIQAQIQEIISKQLTKEETEQQIKKIFVDNAAFSTRIKNNIKEKTVTQLSQSTGQLLKLLQQTPNAFKTFETDLAQLNTEKQAAIQLINFISIRNQFAPPQSPSTSAQEVIANWEQIFSDGQTNNATNRAEEQKKKTATEEEKKEEEVKELDEEEKKALDEAIEKTKTIIAQLSELQAIAINPDNAPVINKLYTELDAFAKDKANQALTATARNQKLEQLLKANKAGFDKITKQITTAQRKELADNTRKLLRLVSKKPAILPGPLTTDLKDIFSPSYSQAQGLLRLMVSYTEQPMRGTNMSYNLLAPAEKTVTNLTGLYERLYPRPATT